MKTIDEKKKLKQRQKAKRRPENYSGRIKTK